MARRWHDKSASERGYGNAWRKLRKAILDRDNHLCVVCRVQGRLVKATTVDHKTQKADGGTDDPENLQSLCKVCHDYKTIRENGGKPKLAAGFDGWPTEDPLDRTTLDLGRGNQGKGSNGRPRSSPWHR